MYQQTKSIYLNKEILGSYLAGLWEGDGHISISKNGKKPRFHITFNIKDSPVAKKLLNYIRESLPFKSEDNSGEHGSIRYQTERNACVLNIYSIQGLKCVVGLINGKLRTPKAYQINTIIHWLNNKENTNINIQKLPNKLPLWKDAWLAGFIDADGSFGVESSDRRVLCRFRLVQRMQYPVRDSLSMHTEFGESYEKIMGTIASYLCVKLNLRKQLNSGRTYYIVSASSVKSKKILRTYHEKYPLLTSKFLDHLDWCCVDDFMLKQQHLTKTNITKINELKQSMNLSRTSICWNHLNLW